MSLDEASFSISPMGAEDPLNISPEFKHYFEGIFFVFWCITVPLYIFLLIVMVKAQYNRVMDLATPFFQICIASSIIDLVTLLNNYFGAVFPKWGWWLSFYVSMGQPYLKMYFYIAWGTGICQAISVSVLASNRLFAMMSPESYTRNWSGRQLKMAISLQFIVGMMVSIPNFFTDVDLIPTDDGQGLVPKILNKPTSKLYFTIGGVFLGLNSLYLICAYAYLYVTLRKLHQDQIQMSSTSRAARTKTEAKRREHRLFLMSTSIVIVQLTILTFFGTFISPVAKLTTEQFYMLYNALSDFYSGINAYLLLIFSDALRAYIKKLCSCYSVDTVAQSAVSTRPLRSRKSSPPSNAIYNIHRR